MTSNFVDIDLGIDLQDSKLELYDYKYDDNTNKENYLIQLKANNNKIIQVNFDGISAFLCREEYTIHRFCEDISKSDGLFLKTVYKLYDEPLPKIIPERYFLFLGQDDYPCIEIVCSGYSFSIDQI